MTDTRHLAEQHMLQYESHLKHLDELFKRAHEGVSEEPEHAEAREELATLKKERDKLASHYEELKLNVKDWQEEEIEKSGPMGVWDALAQQLEKLIERISR